MATRFLFYSRPASTTPLARLASQTARASSILRSVPTFLTRSTQNRPSTASPILQASFYSTPSDAPSNTRTKFVYNVAASYIAKGRAYDPSIHLFQFDPYNRVSPPNGAARGKKARPESGQDAFFVSRLGTNPGEVALGVADGVGGWMESGVDPADFSHAFCNYMAAAANAAAEISAYTGKPLTARQLMQLGYDAVCHDPSIRAGGSTAIVGLLTANGRAEIANLGDSGFLMLRRNGVHAYSEPQTHAFNTPYQLSVVPRSMLLRAAAFGGGQLMDQPADADLIRHQLRHGDVLIFASDGLWDNLFNQQILRIVSQVMARAGAWVQNSQTGVQVAPDLRPFTQLQQENTASSNVKLPSPPNTLQSLLATEIVAAAKAASVSPHLDGPFAKEVKKYYPNESWHGGKEDDICIVVVLVSEEECPSQEQTPAPKAKL
ncbi:phosphoprotein phosphatase-like protein [Thermochaetoides thermophila DSM 1495]|uniref:Protein phosphatase n=1 Tax=Chaetomium thermophilum (strain DSM 1495 / CBS 144.50 / IMI 039719) TaxID=759272 RepID=G0SF61_CHATD|nr:phosphoprotein phosphatase-like protein [Thermochaetoides thermophila DSM 1495]EGS18077.1 phosphoprotein phosphatase-like protein [Thermochaetoides thermophila DSM 1495]